MALTNISKPSTTFANSSKVSFGETWGTITPSWASETRSWNLTASLLRNSLKPLTSSFLVPPTTAARNNFTGSVGFSFTVSSEIDVFQLGRLYVSGNTQNHTVNLWISTDTVTPIATATILASSLSDSSNFKYVTLTSSVTLTPGNTYYVGCNETDTGDMWKDAWLTTSSMQSVFGATTACYSTSQNAFPGTLSTVGYMYDTVAFKTSWVNAPSSFTNLPKP